MTCMPSACQNMHENVKRLVKQCYVIVLCEVEDDYVVKCKVIKCELFILNGRREACFNNMQEVNLLWRDIWRNGF